MEQLLHRIQYYNDQNAFKELFMTIAPQLLAFGYSYTKNKGVTEEIVDDIFINLWKNRNEIHRIDNIKAYLFAGVRKGSINYFTRDKGRTNIDLDQVADIHLQPVTNPEQLYINSELKDKLQNAIDALPGRCKLIFKMVKEDGLKHKEVASILDISQKTVENQLTIAIKKVRDEVQHYFVNENGGDAILQS